MFCTDLSKRTIRKKLIDRLFCFKLNFLFYIGVWPINDVMVDIGGQQRVSHTYTCIHSPPNSLPSRLPHIIEQSSLSYVLGLRWLSILNIAECSCYRELLLDDYFSHCVYTGSQGQKHWSAFVTVFNSPLNAQFFLCSHQEKEKNHCEMPLHTCQDG